jgi:hypothetical protein
LPPRVRGWRDRGQILKVAGADWVTRTPSLPALSQVREADGQSGLSGV